MSINNTYPTIPVSLDLKILTSGKGDYNITVQNLIDFISSDVGQIQQVINDFGGAKWYNKSGGYELGATVKLANGDIVQSKVPNNTTDPNIDMTNWTLLKDSQIQTWSGRTQESKNKDSIHVLDFKKGKTDQETIQDAVNYCLANNRTLDWDGAYLTSTGNISNMWDITHVGSGSVSRDGNTFYFNNASKESGLFINRNQNIITKFTNDGLSEAFPFQPYRINTFFDKFIELNGNYVFNFAAGAYTDASVHRIALGSDSETGKTIPQLSGYIVLKGASTGFDPLTNAIPVPTSVFGADAGAQSAIAINLKGVNVIAQDIRFAGYNGGASSGGIVITNGTLFCRNIHGYRNTYDISGLRSFIDVLGGIIDGGGDKVGTGIRSLFLTKHNIGSQSNVASQTPIIRNKAVGFIAQESSTGHSDFVTYTGCAIGASATVNSRINLNGSTFTSCGVGARSLSGGCLFVPSNVVFTLCPQNTINAGGSVVTDVNSFNYAPQLSMIYFGNTVQTVTSTTSVNVAKVTLPLFWGKVATPSITNFGKKLRIVVQGVMTGVAAGKCITVEVGTDEKSNNGSYVVNASSINGMFNAFKAEFDINVTNQLNSSATITASSNGLSSLNNVINASNLFETRNFLKVTALVGSAGDSIEVRTVEVYATC